MDLNVLAVEIHQDNIRKGFWKSPGVDGYLEAVDRNPLEVLALIHSEVSEVVEEVRKGNPLAQNVDSWEAMPGARGDFTLETFDGKPMIRLNAGGFMHATQETWEDLGYRRKPEGVPSEMADIIIRVLDACAAWGINIEEALGEKLEYNRTRSYKHGKTC